MNEFRKYLEKNGLAKSGLTTRVNYIKTWLEWLKIEVEDSSYKDLMNYIGYLQNEEKSVSQINKRLQTISHYYNFKNLPNIALTTRLKGIYKKANSKPFTIEELDLIYETYQSTSKNYFVNSDQLILGLLIYQGLEMGDFMSLELKDIDLKKGKIYVPKRGHRNERTLKLQSHQIILLHDFIEKYRTKESEYFLNPQSSNYNQLHRQFKNLSRSIKKNLQENLNLKLDKLSQLRQSRIVIWVKTEGLRQAQYKAGFRRVRSAERYRKSDLTDLKIQLKKHHPNQ